MVETITPVVYGSRARWIGGVALHVLGATLTAAIFGAALAATGLGLDAPFGRAGLVLVAGLAIVYAAGSLPGAQVPVPQLRRQVPDWWRTFFSPEVTAFLYGAGLGIGFLTFLATGALVVVAVAAAVSGEPVVGAVILGAFGLARGASAVAAANVRSAEDGRRLVDRLAGRRDVARRVASAATLALVTVAALGAVPDAAAGRAAALAAALVAVAFAWAGVAKITGARRWRRTLAGHGLSAPVQRAAVLAVPLAELAVPALALLGMPSTASWLAVGLLALFSAELVRLRLRRDGPVACGCFGGRGERSAWQLLARNAALGVLAAAGALGSTDMPILVPGPPGPGDALPMALALAGLAVAFIAVARATWWLRRGRA